MQQRRRPGLHLPPPLQAGLGQAGPGEVELPGERPVAGGPGKVCPGGVPYSHPPPSPHCQPSWLCRNVSVIQAKVPVLLSPWGHPQGLQGDFLRKEEQVGDQTGGDRL